LAELGVTCTFLGTLAKDDQQTSFITKDFEATSFLSIDPGEGVAQICAKSPKRVKAFGA